jgi:uncharacterized protein (DUF58 family)
VSRYVPTAQGVAHHRRLVQACYDLFASHEESNFDQAFFYLNRVNRKRSLVCLITNVIDEMNARMMDSYLGTLSGRHLPMAVLLKQREISGLLEQPPESREQLFTQAAAADFLLWKDKVIQDLKNRGVLAYDGQNRSRADRVKLKESHGHGAAADESRQTGLKTDHQEQTEHQFDQSTDPKLGRL